MNFEVVDLLGKVPLRCVFELKRVFDVEAKDEPVRLSREDCFVGPREISLNDVGLFNDMVVV